MSWKSRRGNLSSTPSLLSLASSADTSVKDEPLPAPSTLADCDDQLETYQLLLQGKTKEKTNLINQIKELRGEKEPLFKVKTTLQEEISAANKVINSKTEEVTQLRQKLRHHSEKQIQENIERLEFQLRNNNYKPREEQKILDEMCMLRRSIKTLKEFELKQRENKKYRSERSRLIEQRNEVFSQIQAILFQEEEIKREITEMRRIISSTKRAIDHLKKLRPNLEASHIEEVRKKEEARKNKLKEKARVKKEQYILRHQERKKRLKEYEASIEPFEAEKDTCKMLIAYLQPFLPTKPKEKVLVENVESCYNHIESDTSNSGSFYYKPKFETHENKKVMVKRNKAKAKREQKAGKVRDLSHPPDVIANLGTLNVAVPRTTEGVANCIAAVESKLEQFTLLGEREKEESDGVVAEHSFKNNLQVPSTDQKTQEGKSPLSPNILKTNDTLQSPHSCNPESSTPISNNSQSSFSFPSTGTPLPSPVSPKGPPNLSPVLPNLPTIHSPASPNGPSLAFPTSPNGSLSTASISSNEPSSLASPVSPYAPSIPSPVVTNRPLFTSVYANGDVFSSSSPEKQNISQNPVQRQTCDPRLSNFINPKQYFNFSVPVINNPGRKESNPSSTPTYASVAAGIRV